MQDEDISSDDDDEDLDRGEEDEDAGDKENDDGRHARMLNDITGIPIEAFEGKFAILVLWCLSRTFPFKLSPWLTMADPELIHVGSQSWRRKTR